MANSPFHCRTSHPIARLGFVAATASSLLAAAALGQIGPQLQATTPAAPPAAPASPTPPPAAGQQLEAYPVSAASKDVMIAWQNYAAGRTDLRVAIDERTSQVLVWATPAVHGEIRRQIAAKGAAMQVQAQAAGQAPAANQPQLQLQPQVQPAQSIAATPVSAAPPADPAMLQLKRMQPAELHTRFERLLNTKIPVTMDGAGEWQSFAVEASPGVGVTLNVSTRTGQVRIDGQPQQVAAWRSVVEALDSPPASPEQVTQVVSTKPANHDRVRKTLQTLQASTAQTAVANPLVSMLFQQQQGEGAARPGAAPQTPPAGTGTTQVSPSDVQTALDAAKLAEAAGGLLGPVQVEFVEGLDVIVLRGAERDVQRVMEIINQIEQLSAETVPAIQVYELKHVDSVQLGALLNRLYTSVLAGRIGTVSITPLGQPNALLLIGRDENVRMAIELINRLDQPIVPAARFEVFPLQHASATEVKTLVDGFLGQPEGTPPEIDQDEMPTLAPRALVIADARTNSLIVIAGPRDIAEIAALVQRIDRPGATAELKVFTVINGDATTLVETLRSLFGTPTDVDEEGGGGGVGAGGPVRIQFSVDPRTNSIIAAGSREDLAVVEAILLRLDQGDLRERKTTVHKLNNAFAQNVAEALNQWLQTERQVEATVDLAISPFEQIEREVIIVPELATNSLIVSATPRFYEEVIRIIRELDERPPMVLVQVLIAEVRLNDTDQFGVELGLQDSVLFDRSLLSDVQQLTTTVQNQVSGTAVSTTQQTVINANGQPGFNFNNPNLPLGNNVLTPNTLATASQVGAQGLSNFAVNRLDPTLGFSGFVFSASSDAVSVLLRALQEKRRLEVLSRPQLMALDGQQGSVQVGQDVPVIRQTNFDQFGGTINTIDYRQVGLILQLIPRISPDGLVVMQIAANKSEVGPEIEGIPISISTNGQVLRAPRIEVTQAITTVSALSGQTVVLSGLMQTRKSDLHRRVPILADIPLLGSLFRFDSVSEERRELLIILTPQVIYNKLDSDLVKQIESSRMSWILSDVVSLHGEAGLRSRCDEWFEGECDSIYPNFVPEEGVLPLSRDNAMSIQGECVTPQYESMPAIEPPTNFDTLPTPAPSPNNRQQPAMPPQATSAIYNEPVQTAAAQTK